MRTGKLDDIASLVCHQIDARSLNIGGEYLPLCARCTGIYSGFLVAVLSQLLAGDMKFARPLTSKKVFISLILLLALITESMGERLRLWEFSNTGRFHIGFLGGLSMGILLLPLCSHFLGYRPSPVTNKAVRQWAVFITLTAGVLSLQWLSVPLPVLAIVSMLGLLSIYLFLNLAISAAVLGPKDRNYNPAAIMLLFGLVLALFAGEWTLFNVFKSQ